jgi:dipeptidyl aminopeptidase/acylaminoacyl peptidase
MISQISDGLQAGSMSNKYREDEKTMEISRLLSIAYLILAVSLVSCSFSEAVNNLTSEPSKRDVASTTPVPTERAEEPSRMPEIISSPTAGSPSPTVLAVKEPNASQLPTRAADGRITEIQWSDDSDVIYYYVQGGGSWMYDIQSGRKEAGVNPPPTATTLPLPNIPSITNFSVSPSGQRLLYVLRLSPTVTPLPPVSPEAMGEPGSGDGDNSAQLWLADRHGEQFIGEIEDCVADFLWPEDETYAVLVAIPRPAPCVESFAWFVDMETNTITNLFPRAQYDEMRHFALSPSSQRLLYYHEDQLQVLDIESGTSRSLEVPEPSFGIWLDDQTILMRYRPEGDRHFILGIYDLETDHLSELVGPRATPLLQGMVLDYLRISPDGRWLAFAAGAEPYKMDSMWLLALPPS